MPSSPTRVPTPTRRRSTGCSRRRTTANAGRGRGSISPATPTPTATRRTTAATIWKYRDWVIDAFNRDMPFDQFTVEQIAGDMLPNATIEQKIATGFHRNAMTNEEGGVDPEESRYEVLVDRANTTATVWLGSTLACAQCHNHKYDPFTQKDYFRLLSFFANNDYDGRSFGDGTRYFEPALELATPEQESGAQGAAGEDRAPRSAAENADARADARRRRRGRNRCARRSPAGHRVTPAVGERDQRRRRFACMPDGSVLASGVNAAATSLHRHRADCRSPNITGVRIEALPDASLPRGGPGRDGYGHFRVTGIHVGGRTSASAADAGAGRIPDRESRRLRHAVRPGRVCWAGSRAAYARKGGSWAINAMRDTAERLPRNAVLAAAAPLAAPVGTRAESPHRSSRRHHRPGHRPVPALGHRSRRSARRRRPRAAAAPGAGRSRRPRAPRPQSRRARRALPRRPRRC